MKIDKTKIISYILGIIMFISTFKLEFKGILTQDKSELPKKDFTTSQTNNKQEKQIKSKSPTIEPTKVTETTESIIIETTIPTEPKLTEQLVYSTNNTYLYTNNSDSSLKIKEFKINEFAIKLLTYDNNWTLVKYNNQFGYVKNYYLEYSSNFIETEYEHIKQKDIDITKTNLNFRLLPTTESEIITTFSPYTELTVVAEVNDEWLLVNYNDTFGYVNKYYTISLLEVINKQYPELNINKIKTEKVVYSTVNDLNIHKGNNTDYDSFNQLAKYESVRVLAEYPDCYFIMTNEYQFGFINKEYTKELTEIYIVVDLSRQILYLYNNNELYYTTPVTTGKNSTPSDIGTFKIWYKGTDEEIVPEYVVSHWMPYNNNMEGLHDAKNRTFFGIKYSEVYLNENNEIIAVISEENIETDYRIYGSNGCINIPPNIAKKIYEIAPKGTKVLVHK